MLSEYNLFKMDFVKNTVNLQNTLELKYNNKIVWNINLKYNLLKLLSTKLDMLGSSLLYCNNNDIISLYFLKDRFIIEKGSKYPYIFLSKESREKINNKNKFFFAKIHNGNILKDDTFRKCIIYDSKYEDLINKNYDLFLDYWRIRYWWEFGIEYSYNDISTSINTIPREIYNYINNVKIYSDIRNIIFDKITYFKVTVDAQEFYSTMVENIINTSLEKHTFNIDNDNIYFDSKHIKLKADIEKI